MHWNAGPPGDWVDAVAFIVACNLILVAAYFIPWPWL